MLTLSGQGRVAFRTAFWLFSRRDENGKDLRGISPFFRAKKVREYFLVHKMFSLDIFSLPSKMTIVFLYDRKILKVAKFA